MIDTVNGLKITSSNEKRNREYQLYVPQRVQQRPRRKNRQKLMDFTFWSGTAKLGALLVIYF